MACAEGPGIVGGRSRLQPVAALLVFVMAWAAFASMLPAYWRHDDFGWQHVAREWEEGHQSLWERVGFTPAYNLLYHTLHLAAGRDPVPYRAVFTTIHALTAVAVAWLCLILTDSRLAAAWAGALFALHFVHHEAVGWIAATVHLPAAALAILAVGCWTAGRRRDDARLLVLAVALAALAPMFKESGLAVFPLIAAAELVLPLPRAGSGGPVLAALAALPAALYVALRLSVGVWTEVVPAGGELYDLGPHVLVNLAACVPQMIVPDMAFENYRALLGRVLTPAVVPAAVIASRALIGLLAAASVYLLVRGSDRVRFAVAWMYLAFLPTAPFVYEYARAPRYLYLPSAGLALLFGIAVASAVRRWPGRGLAITAVAAVVLAANLVPLGVFARSRLRDSRIRRTIAQELPRVLPDPRPGQRVGIRGVPGHINDLGLMALMLYGRHVEIVPLPEGEPARSVDSLLTLERGRLWRAQDRSRRQSRD
ncbi:MAG: hypothetical protein U9R79_11285 [Armatimonadota bacterium]|nr:hypothetical protein [Armatimonadota bacterium]